MGDGLLVQFSSVVDAVRCALDSQRKIGDVDARAEVDRRIELRMGINVGDVVIDGKDLYGDGVNIAARLEGLAEPEGSASVVSFTSTYVTRLMPFSLMWVSSI